MAAKGTMKASLKPPESGKKFPLATVIIGVLLLPVGFLTFKQFRKWSTVTTRANQQAAEVQEMKERNTSLAVAYDILQNKKFTVCNKSPYPLQIAWLSATYHDGKALKIFDSSRCGAWHGLEVASGENKNLFLSSSQEGCNWSGGVIYFAMRFSKETDEASIPYTVVGRYHNFDRDCYNVQ